MGNELLFLIMSLIGLVFTLFCFRMGRIWLYAYVGVAIVLANIFVTKQIMLFGLSATGGNVMYGTIFLATDLLSEHYGKFYARRAVFIGFFAAIIYLVMSQLMTAFTPAEYDTVHNGMQSIFSFAPRIILGSLTAYLASQLYDVWFFHFLKERTQGKLLWFRNNLSTWVSQLIDSVIFTLVAFFGTFEWSVILQIILTTYVLKIIIAAIDTPFIYLSYKIKPQGE
ncbi:MAG: queuosine precursor transporter [Candidatus Marinimicrobia bacterium]|nr:queuosine precursor transporter [Candidatus Neomarinimicrobiota bacterium]MCF7828177.1 queuosine precursor transporter [Candidatus Neomarinimicrobiota bacterium]MCF7879648.1 queuosine precursor transporter [Candidatus Neomarinimicrobiota bacterium]